MRDSFGEDEWGLRVVNVSWGRDLLGVLTAWLMSWREREGDPMCLGDVRIFLPNRRSVRELNRRLLSESRECGALIFPRVEALGDVEDDRLSLEGGLGGVGSDFVSFDGIERELILFRFVWSWLKAREGKGGGVRGDVVRHAFGLARGLGVLMDELDIQDVDVSDIDGLVPESLALHWQVSREFLVILKTYWPEVCRDRGKCNGIWKRMQNLRKVAEGWRLLPVESPVLVVGSTGSVPATSALMKVVVDLPKGKVVLPGVDRVMGEDEWEAVAEDMAHPQHGFYGVLKLLGVEREDVKEWGRGEEVGMRERLLSKMMRPSSMGGGMGDLGVEGGRDKEIGGLDLYEAESEGEESVYVASVLREVLEHEGKTAAFVCPDEDLKRGVMSELRRWGVEVDSSSGVLALEEGGGLLVGYLLDFLIEGRDPSRWLGILHHPLCRMGRKREEVEEVLWCVQRLRRESEEVARTFEGLESQIKKRMKKSKDVRWEKALKFARDFRLVFRERFGKKKETLEGYVEKFIDFCEVVSRGEGEDVGMIWKGEEGSALADCVMRVRMYGGEWGWEEETEHVGKVLQGFLREVRIHRLSTNQPRLMVLDPMEARLQCFDCVVLGGLNEGSWPGSVKSSPWMSRPMREKLGLMSHEKRVGMQAHDFVRAWGSKEVVLTRSKMKGGEPTLESRWLARLGVVKESEGLRLARLGVVKESEGLRFDEGLTAEARKGRSWLMRGVKAERVVAPRVSLRPGMFPLKVSVTGFDRLRDNPYGYYAEKILRLREPPNLGEKGFYKERGLLLHKLMQEMTEYSERHGEEDVEALLAHFEERLEERLILETEIPSLLKVLWEERWKEIGRMYGEEILGEKENTLRMVCEAKGEVELKGGVILHGRADRLDILKEGGVRVVDLKTGTLTGAKKIKTMEVSQLALLSLLVFKGGYKDLGEEVDREPMRASLYPLKMRTEKKKGVNVDWSKDYEGDWWKDAEEMVVNEVLSYARGEKEVVMKEKGNSDSYRSLTRFAEWGHGE